MLFNRIFAVVYLMVTIVGGITFFNNSSIQDKEYIFYAVFIFSIVQFVYSTFKIVGLENKLNEKR